MSYTLKIKHVRPYFRNGDRETEFASLGEKVFKSRKAATEWIASNMKSRNCVNTSYTKFSSHEWWVGVTNKTWFNEGTGETDQEQFQYSLYKN